MCRIAATLEAASFEEPSVCSFKASALYLRIENDGIRDRDRRLPFSDDDLRRIFDPKHFPFRDEPSAYWIPVLGLFTGCPLGELCQLRASDVREVEGIGVLDINDEHTGKRIKTIGAARLIPLHSELVRLNFIEFAEKIRRKHGNDAHLFPELVGASGYYPSDLFSKRFARHLDRCGITDKRITYHSARHGFKDKLENAGTPPHILDAILGWSSSGKGMSALYGGPPKLKLLKKAIDRITFALPLCEP